MFLLWFALLIQMSYYIVHHAYPNILMSIILTLGLRKFSKNEYVYILLPMVSSHIFFLLWHQTKERFKKLKPNNIKKSIAKKIDAVKSKAKEAVKSKKIIAKLKKVKVKHTNKTLQNIHNLTNNYLNRKK